MQNIQNSLLYRITLWLSMGSLVEYYDFVVYAMMTKYIAILFFPTQDKSLAIIQSFLIFAVGYFARPFGGTLIGMMGDRFGRKPAFLMLTALMSLSTFAIGCLPIYDRIGFCAPLLLLVFRIFQGISYAGELPGATTIIGEFAPQKSLGRFTSFIISSTSIGAILATFVLYVLTSTFEESEILAFGWRFPFIMGGCLGLILLALRLKLLETPVFTTHQRVKLNPFILLLKDHYKNVLQGFSLTSFFASLVLLNLFFPYYIPTFFGFDSKDVYFGITISLVFSAFIFPFCGKFSDLFPKRNILIKTTLFYLLTCLPLFSLLLFRHTINLILFLIFHQFFIALFGSSYFPLMTRLFPTSVRYTGIAFCYNLTFAFMALLPSFLTSLIHHSHPWVVPGMMCFFALISLTGAIKLPSSERDLS
ncbi:MAG: MFS transporter [Proteobacteria bacterium]|nr:MFS transporter [Pseudomonadota bacterium]